MRSTDSLSDTDRAVRRLIEHGRQVQALRSIIPAELQVRHQGDLVAGVATLLARIELALGQLNQCPHAAAKRARAILRGDDDAT